MEEDNEMGAVGVVYQDDKPFFQRTQGKLAIGGAITLFVLIFGIIILADSIHTIDEGNVGIYYRQGALQEHFTLPGVNWAAPFITNVEEVRIRPTTDELPTISAVTKDGIQISFFKLQVMSSVELPQLISLIRKFGIEFKKALIFDRISEDLRLFCASKNIDEVYNSEFLDIAPTVKTKVESSVKRLGLDGVIILNLVVPKPDIPSDIAQNYKQVKVQWTEQLVATQQQKTETIKKQTEELKAIADAERLKNVLKIDLTKGLLQKEAEQNISRIENAILKERQENLARVDNFKKRQAAEANELLYSDNYVKLEVAKALSNNTKIFFSGEQAGLGSIFNKILSS
eukprot:maker-scaffold209_size256900-snap-gene-1.31 protein:Tk05664 transcript:maker-scaffold209_size256900-snap-gene-1.31-mRNA-1 annotation:"Erlin-2"